MFDWSFVKDVLTPYAIHKFNDMDDEETKYRDLFNNMYLK